MTQQLHTVSPSIVTCSQSWSTRRALNGRCTHLYEARAHIGSTGNERADSVAAAVADSTARRTLDACAAADSPLLCWHPRAQVAYYPRATVSDNELQRLRPDLILVLAISVDERPTKM